MKHTISYFLETSLPSKTKEQVIDDMDSRLIFFVDLFRSGYSAQSLWENKYVAQRNLNEIEASLIYLRINNIESPERIAYYEQRLLIYKSMWKGAFLLLNTEFGEQFKNLDEEKIKLNKQKERDFELYIEHN